MTFMDLVIKARNKLMLQGIKTEELKITIEVSSRLYSTIGYCIDKYYWENTIDRKKINLSDFQIMGLNVSINRNYDL